MRIVLLGAPGSGKGTQAIMMTERYRAPHISTGDLLRAAVKNRSALGKKAKTAMDAGELVPDEIVLELLVERLKETDTRRGFILDGYPRNIPQAQELDSRLGWMGRPLQIALYTEVSPNVLVKRISGRQTCDNCGAIYNLHFSPPTKRGICDACGEKKLTKRSDDNEKTARTRLEVYQTETEPLIAYYRAQHKLRTVKSEDPVEVIAEKIATIIDSEIRPLEMDVFEPAAETHQQDEPDTAIVGGTVVKLEKPKPKPVMKPKAKASEKPAVTAKKPKLASKRTKKTTSAAKSSTAGKSAKKKATKKKLAKKAGKRITKKPAGKKTGKKTPQRKKAVTKTAVRKSAKKTAAKKTATKATKTARRKKT